VPFAPPLTLSLSKGESRAQRKRKRPARSDESSRAVQGLHGHDVPAGRPRSFWGSQRQRRLRVVHGLRGKLRTGAREPTPLPCMSPRVPRIGRTRDFDERRLHATIRRI